MVIIVFGLPGSGKSYFASRLANRIKADYIKSDKVRMDLFKKSTYAKKEKLAVYNEMLKQMKEILKDNGNVVLDATFNRNHIRRKFIAEAEKKGGATFIEVIADEHVIKKRLTATRMDSDADFEVHKKIRNEWEPLNENHLILQSTDDNIEAILDKATSYLHLRNDNKTNK